MLLNIPCTFRWF